MLFRSNAKMEGIDTSEVDREEDGKFFPFILTIGFTICSEVVFFAFIFSHFSATTSGESFFVFGNFFWSFSPSFFKSIVYFILKLCLSSIFVNFSASFSLLTSGFNPIPSAILRACISVCTAAFFVIGFP